MKGSQPLVMDSQLIVKESQPSAKGNQPSVKGSQPFAKGSRLLMKGRPTRNGGAGRGPVMASVGILRYAAFHHIEHGLTDGRIHHLHHSSDHAACLPRRRRRSNTHGVLSLLW